MRCRHVEQSLRYAELQTFIRHRHVAELELRYHLGIDVDSIHGVCV